ncbi:hypothetical protein D3C80_2082650 [compost metagenome]
MDGCFQITAVGIVVIAGQASAAFQRLRIPGQDRHPVPRCLPLPDRPVADSFQLRGGKRTVDRLEFLQTGDVRLLALKPGQ